MRSMGERYAKVVGIIVLALAIAATLLFLLFLAATVQIAARDGAGEAAGPAFAVLCVGGCAAVCWWRGLWCLAQVRQGMPLARYRLGSDARAVVVEPLTPAECPAGGPFKPGLFLYSDSYRPDDNLTGFDIVHNEVHAIDTEGISPVTEQCQRGYVFNRGRVNNMLVFTLFCDTFVFAFELDALRVEERRVNDTDDGPVDAGRREWGDTRVVLVPRRCYKVPYAAVVSCEWHEDPAWLRLVRGRAWLGVDLHLADGSTLFTQVSDYPLGDAPAKRRERFERGCDELERLIAAGSGKAGTNE